MGRHILVCLYINSNVRSIRCWGLSHILFVLSCCLHSPFLVFELSVQNGSDCSVICCPNFVSCVFVLRMYMHINLMCVCI